MNEQVSVWIKSLFKKFGYDENYTKTYYELSKEQLLNFLEDLNRIRIMNVTVVYENDHINIRHPEDQLLLDNNFELPYLKSVESLNINRATISYNEYISESGQLMIYVELNNANYFVNINGMFLSDDDRFNDDDEEQLVFED